MNIPRLYNKYAGHDDNRDSFMSNLTETKNINHFMFWEWHPVIMYNHHQTGPAGTVMFSPPFRDPFNYNFDPMIVMGLDMVGAAIHQRLLEEEQAGLHDALGLELLDVVERRSAHDRLLPGHHRHSHGERSATRRPSEFRSSPTSSCRAATFRRRSTPQVWHFRQSIDYSVTANYAIFDLASRYRETLLYNKYLMAKHAIDEGQPRQLDDLRQAHRRRRGRAQRRARTQAGAPPAGGRGGRGGRGGGAARRRRRGDQPGGAVGNPGAPFGRGNGNVEAQMHAYNDVLHAKDKRDPRGYIIPSDQPDFLTAIKFVNTLRHVGVYVDQATGPFTVAGKNYPAGSFVIKTAQAARGAGPRHDGAAGSPERLRVSRRPSASPIRQRRLDARLRDGREVRPRPRDGFDVANAKQIRGTELVKPMAGTLANASGAAGFLMSHEENDAVTVLNRVFKANGEVDWLRSPLQIGGKTWPAGTFFIPAAQRFRCFKSRPRISA